MERIHVDLIDIWPFFAIHFDVDEQFVHHLRSGFVLKRLVCHDVAPVACGVTNREQDRPVFSLRLGQGVRSPGPPVNRIVLVLEQIR